jgi:tetratricopeptide (TPR) repeat protein
LDISAERTWVERAERIRREADLLLAKGHHVPAEKLYREASDILLSAFGSSHTNYTESLNDLAMVYLAMGRYSEAIARYQQVLDISRMAVGEDGPLYLASLGNLAAAHRAMGDFSDAQGLYRQGLQIHGKSQRKDVTGIAKILVELAWIYAHTGRVREALDAFCDAERARDQMIAEVVARGSEREQFACRESMREAYFLFLSFVLRYCPDSSDATHALLEVIFRRKALWIEMTLAQRDASIRDRSLSIQRRYGALRSLRQRIARKTVQGLSVNEAPDVRYRELHNRDTERRELEEALAREVAGLDPFDKRLGGIDVHAVASALPSNSALVEFAKFRRYDFESIRTPGRDSWQEYRYLALVLVDGAPPAVRIVDLGEALMIDRLMTGFRSWIMRAANAQDRGFVSDDELALDALESPGMALRAAVFDPLKPVLGGRSRVILATDGELARIPFEALPLV